MTQTRERERALVSLCVCVCVCVVVVVCVFSARAVGCELAEVRFWDSLVSSYSCSVFVCDGYGKGFIFE